jgi:NhaA family Na+:H+ antiporter
MEGVPGWPVAAPRPSDYQGPDMRRGCAMYRVWHFISSYSLLLVAGALIALVWANVAPGSYHDFVEFRLFDNPWVGHLHEDGAGHAVRTLTLHYLINDVLMAFFFAVAGKEVWEAIALKEGELRGRKAATPLVATLGGMIGPVAVYLGLAALLGSETYDAVFRGWAIPTATDIAFSYLVGRIVFGAGHPAVRFLLLLAIADDAGGLLILAIFYPTGDLAPAWLLFSLGAAWACCPGRWRARSAGTGSSRVACTRHWASCRSCPRCPMPTAPSASLPRQRSISPTFSTTCATCCATRSR